MTQTVIDFADVEIINELNALASKLSRCKDLNIERIGTWLWISGETKKHKTMLKNKGFKYSPKRQMWYYAVFKKQSRDINELREKFGSVEC